ncbi:MAG: elongation factor P maturation arginine rhamnosyltransferase EarP [Ramlibacter sp.]|nr:elongation factor P maturation arginine rhamnosyltransferase EarP [Ramlibacter sp.]
MLWDIFCKVIDNHGDIGVCWRLSAQLAARGEQVRLWADDASALAWMAPGGCAGVQVMPWNAQSRPAEPGDAVIEAFGCELDPPVQREIAARSRARGRQPAWINLEYLSAESFARRSHGLPSPVLAGPAAGLTKHFFYPGFTTGTGGLLREPDLLWRQAQFDRRRWLGRWGVTPDPGTRVVSLFCYEPSVLDTLLAQLAHAPDRTHLLVTAGRAAAAVRTALARNAERDPDWNRSSALSISFLPLLTQTDFDHLLWASDLNFVRGEDSLVRALWAGKPLVWQLYPQHDDAHHAKLAAFLDWLEAPADLRAFHLAWNGAGGAPPDASSRAWSDCVLQGRARLLAQDDLATQLMRFALAPGRAPA